MRLRLLALVGIIAIALTMGGCSKKESASKETASPETALFEKANQAQAATKYQEAVDCYLQILKEHPASKNLDKALFMIGFIKSESQNDKQGSLFYYQQLLDKFPNSDLADDAEFMIETINSGKDPLSAFQQKSGQ